MGEAAALDAKAREGGYEGPSPLDATLDDGQKAARKAGLIQTPIEPTSPSPYILP